MAIVTCHTPGCVSEGVEIDAVTTWTDDDGATHPVDLVVCGGCGQPIDDLA